MPLISPLLRAASRNELRTVLRIWGVTLFRHICGCLPLSLATRAISATWTYSEKLTFGIYLCHFIFVYISFDLFDIESVNTFLRIIGMTAASFTCAAILTAILRLTPSPVASSHKIQMKFGETCDLSNFVTLKNIINIRPNTDDDG